MGQEIERKFLVVGDEWRALAAAPRVVRQGYLASSAAASVRVRAIGAHAYLTVKSTGPGLVRSEFEYAIPFAEAEAMLAHLCAPLQKRRSAVTWCDLDWVIDEFEGALEGLVIAEIELHYADQDIELPPWIGREVTDDPLFRNESLARLGLPPGSV